MVIQTKPLQNNPNSTQQNCLGSQPQYLQPSFSHFEYLLQKLNNKLERTDVPGLIINFRDYQKWPKILYRYYMRLQSNFRSTYIKSRQTAAYKSQQNAQASQGQLQASEQVVMENKQDQKCVDTKQSQYESKSSQNQSLSPKPTISKKLKQQIQKLMTNIYQRLFLLGEYGDLFITRIKKQIQYFCPTLNKNDWVNNNYLPSNIDKQLQRITKHYKYRYEYNDNSRLKLQSQFNNSLALTELQQRIKIFYEARRKRRLYEQQIKKKDQQINYLLSPNHQLQYVDRSCLRCTTHFLKNTTTNAYHPSISFYPVDSYQLNNYESFSYIENNVKASICAMLNQPAGGIILLGVQKQGTSILPKGLYISQKQKDSLQQKIQGYFQKIYPKVKRNQQIFIHFIPVVQLKQNQDQNSHQRYISSPVAGFYVCRIFMLPKQAYKIYLLKASLQHSTLQARKHSQSVTVSDSKHYKYLVKKFDMFFQPKQKEKSYIINSHYTIQCDKPMVGKLVYGSANTTYTNSYYSPTKDIYANSSSKNKDYDSDDDMDTQEISSKSIKNLNYNSYNNASNKVNQHKIWLPSQIQNKKPQQYKFWTLVVGDKATVQKIKQLANEKEKKGIKIQKLFEQRKFKLLKTTWVMYHDDKFQTMKKLTQKYSIVYKGKQIRMIASNIYLQVEGGIATEYYTNLCNTLVHEYGTQIKQLTSKPINKGIAWVMKFASLKGSIFAYFYLSDLDYKVKFIRGASYFAQNNVITPSPIISGSTSTSIPADNTPYSSYGTTDMSNTYDYTQQYQAYQYGMGTQGMANAEYYYPYNQQMAYGYYGNQEAYYANGLQGYYNGYGTTNSSANGSTTTGNGQVNPAGYTHNQTYQG